jgi:putative ABC transport system permease protein
MPVLVRIAFRNLLEHRAKSLIIGVLIALGVVILVVGNSFMDTAAKGVKDTFTGNYTGDLFVSAKSRSPISLFGMQSVGGMESTPVLPYFDKVLEKIKSEPGVVAYSSQVTGFAVVSPKDSEKQGFAILFGIEPASYYKVFQNADAVEGRLLRPGEPGLLISSQARDRYEKEFGFTPKLGETLLLTGLGNSSFSIRAVPLVGIIKYKTETDATSFISYADVNTVRLISGMTIGSALDAPVSERQKAILSASEEDLFAGEKIVAAGDSVAPPPPPRPADLKPDEADTGAWHFILARTKSPAAAKTLVASLNLWFAQEGIEAQAGDWKSAAGPFATSIDVVRIIFNVAIIIVAIVAVIIMMNTLVISVIERTGEIGTMRALGAQKSFVRRMFLIETLTIASVFGLVGLAIAFGTIWILGAANIQASNPFLEILFAGKVLKPAVNALSVAMSLVLVGIVAVIAHLYPVSIALKIEPVRAMQTE